MGISILTLWTSRKHIMRVVMDVFSTKSGDPLYRVAVFGLVRETTFVLFFWYQAGLSPGGALDYFGIYFALCIAMTRMRAELGPPTHKLHGMHPDRLPILFLDTRALGATNLTNTTLLS